MKLLRIPCWLLLTIISLASVVDTVGAEPPLSPPLVITKSDLPPGTAGVEYKGKLSATGGKAPLTWTVDPKLPDDLKLEETGDQAGTISGTPTRAGTFKFNAQVKDQNGKTAPKEDFKIIFLLSVLPDALPDGKVGVDYSAKLSVSGGSDTQTWKLTKGVLPNGLKLTESGDQAGTISGKPTKVGSYTFTVAVKDEGRTSAADAPNTSNASTPVPAATGSQELSIVVDPEFGSAIASSLCCRTASVTSKNDTIPTRISNIIFGEVGLIALLGLLYWLAMVIIRWHRIARPSREFLRAKIATDIAELSLYPLQQEERSGDRDEVRGVLLKAGLAISPKFAGRRWWYRLSNFLFWSRGEEMAAWTYLHSAEVKMVSCMPLQTVTTRLEAAEQQLRTFNDANDPRRTGNIALAETIHEALTATKPGTPSDRLKALLVGALTNIYEHSDASASDDISWQNKTSWLVGCSVLVLVALTFAVPYHSILLIVGAVGGLVSRMTRSLDRKSVPTDYGASWTTIFLSPVSGALGAWAGVLLTELAVSMQVLGDVFKSDFANPCNSHTLAIAFVFGFSERLLDGVLDKLEEKTQAVAPRTDSAAPPTPPPPSPDQTGGPVLTITTTATDIPKGTVGVAYSFRLVTSGESGAVTWSKVDGDLPDGLNLTESGDQAGAISGTPKTAGTSRFTLQATDQNNKPANLQLSIVVDEA